MNELYLYLQMRVTNTLLHLHFNGIRSHLHTHIYVLPRISLRGREIIHNKSYPPSDLVLISLHSLYMLSCMLMKVGYGHADGPFRGGVVLRVGLLLLKKYLFLR